MRRRRRGEGREREEREEEEESGRTFFRVKLDWKEKGERGGREGEEKKLEMEYIKGK